MHMHAVIVHGRQRTNVISSVDWSCNCAFVATMKLACRHVIAYRKHAKVPGTFIPWSRIDERWTSLHISLQSIRQFEYQPFDENLTESADVVTKRQKRSLSRTERYHEAVRATHLIANELGDIEDEIEYRAMLNFVLDHWRNVRLRRRLGTAPDDEITRAQDSINTSGSDQDCDMIGPLPNNDVTVQNQTTIAPCTEQDCTMISTKTNHDCTMFKRSPDHDLHIGDDLAVVELTQSTKESQVEPKQVKVNTEAKKVGRKR